MNIYESLQNSEKESVINFNIEKCLGIEKNLNLKLNVQNSRPYKKKKTKGIYYCDICSKSYSRIDSLNRHKRMQHNQSKFNIKNSQNKQFSIEPIILESYHINEEFNSGQYTCDVCSVSCDDMTEWFNHMKTHYMPEKLKKYDYCYESYSNFESTSSLDQEKLFTRHQCKNSFTSSYDLTNHQNSHCNDSTVKLNHVIESSNCNVEDEEIIYDANITSCSKNQHNNDEETFHENETQNFCTDIHKIKALKEFNYDVQMFDCDICQNKCSRIDHLEIYHWTKDDSIENEEIHECYVCSKCFPDKESLKLHETEHIDQMIF